MNKKELVRVVSKVTNMTTRDVELVLTSILEIIMVSVSKKEVVRLIGFGSFRIYQKKRTPVLEDSLDDVSITRTVRFSPGKFFREFLISTR